MEYILLNINFVGSDDAPIDGFIAREVESEKEWLKQIKSSIKEEFKENDYLEIYHSDNCSTPMESVEEVLSMFSMKKITQEQFLVLKTLFAYPDSDVVKYGHDEGFLEYYPPVPKIKPTILHGEVIEEIKLYYKDETSNKLYNIQLEKVEGGYVVNYQNGKNKGADSKLTEGTKTDGPVPYDNAKEIYDALIKYKNDYTTDPSGIKPNKHSLKDLLS